MAGKGKLNVILDIDETLLQFVGDGKKDRIPEDMQEEYDYLTDYFIARPHLDEFMKFLSENCATVNIWTWSDKPYADEVAELIQDRVPGLKFTNVWADTDANASVKMYGHHKDLNYIWYKKGQFDPCNTILIDDAADNTKNKSNYRNVIRVPEFSPTGNAKKALNDSAFLKVIEMLKAAMENPAFCSKGDLPFPFEDAKPGKPRTIGGKRKTIRRHKRSKKTMKQK